jgi:hypothetical protein
MSEVQSEQQQTPQANAEVLYSEQKPTTPAAPQDPPANVDTPNAEAQAAIQTEQTQAETPPSDEQKPYDKSATKADETKDTETLPEKYDLKLPDQSLVDPKRLADIEAEARASKMTQEQAQALVDREHKIMSELVKSHQDRINGWMQESIADKEIGGPEINRNIELAKRLVDTFGSPLLKKQLEDSGMGQNPELLRLFVRLGKAYGEDRLVTGAKGVPVKKSSPADLLFGDTPEQN